MNKGFTLIEILLVAAILVTISIFGLSQLARWRANTAVNEAAQEMGRAVYNARLSAKKANACARFELDGSTGYKVTRFTGSTCSGANTVSVGKLPAGTTVSASGTVTTIEFNPPYGTTDAAPNTYLVRWSANALLERTVRVTGIFGKVIIK